MRWLRKKEISLSELCNGILQADSEALDLEIEKITLSKILKIDRYIIPVFLVYLVYMGFMLYYFYDVSQNFVIK